jgi:hypothetical protein
LQVAQANAIAKPAKELAYPNAPTKDNAAKNEHKD